LHNIYFTDGIGPDGKPLDTPGTE